MLTIIRRLAIVILAGLSVAQARAAESDIVDGFTEFLVERANANLIAVFERRLKNDRNFQCYFPNTYAKIEKLRLEDLFASKSYWEKSLEADLKMLAKRAVFVEAQQSLAILDRTDFIEALQTLEYQHPSREKPYPIDQIQFAWDKEVIDQINGFWFGIADALEKIDSLKIYHDVCELTLDNEADFDRLLETYEAIGADIARWVDHMGRYGKNLRLSAAKRVELYCRVREISPADCSDAEIDETEFSLQVLSNNETEELAKAMRIARRVHETLDELERLEYLRDQEVETIDKVVLLLPLLETDDFTAAEIRAVRARVEAVKKLNKEDSRQALVEILAAVKSEFGHDLAAEDADFVRVAELLRGLMDGERSHTDRALVALELLEESNQFNDSEVERLRRSVMFFVSIADAEDKDAVKSILEAYTLPAVSYTEKRKQGYGFFISSYLGMGLADSDVHGSQEEASDGGLFVPVGLEYNYGRSDGASVSIMLSPIDMAYPVNLKLRGIEEDVEFDELIAPSLAVSYGVEDWPVNVGIAYQRGRRLDDVDKSEEIWLLFFTFDMPLLRLY